MILEIGLQNLDFRSILVAVLGMGVVFIALLLLVLFFTNIPRVGRFFRKGASSHAVQANGDVKKVRVSSNIPAGDSAVIAATIYLFLNEIHDEENRVSTIKRVSRTYSPWNSKIYGVNWLRTR